MEVAEVGKNGTAVPITCAALGDKGEAVVDPA
jgi:hypothetical protein